MVFSFISLYYTFLLSLEQVAESNSLHFNEVSSILSCPGVEFVSREDWGAKPSKENNTMKMPVDHVFIHHTAMAECDDFHSCARMVRIIQDFHMGKDRNWDDIGYNFLIGGDGKVYVGRGWERVGAHTYGFNTVSVAFSLMGNFMEKTPNEKMLRAARLMDECARMKNYVKPDAKLHGHRDAGCTLCPGDQLYAIIKTWPHFQGGPISGAKCWPGPSKRSPIS